MKTVGSAYGHRDPVKWEDGSRVSANLYNFDGRHNDPVAGIFPPDVDDPAEVLVGELQVVYRNSAWGPYTTMMIQLDDGTTRYIEPDTIKQLTEGAEPNGETIAS